MNLESKYIELLHDKYIEYDRLNEWEKINFLGINKVEEEELLNKNVPITMINLLKIINGTSDYTEFLGYKDIPYCLFNCQKILDTDMYFIKYCLKEVFDFDPKYIDEKIDINNENLKWFKIGQDSFNNGGTSSIYIDMTPSNKGTIGQIVRFVHDPDTYDVIANSMEDFLQMIIDDDFSFLSEE